MVRIGHEAAYYCADFGWLMKMEFAGAAELRSCLKFFLRIFETRFCAGFCRFLRRIAALLCDKNGRKMPKWWHKELLKKF